LHRWIAAADNPTIRFGEHFAGNGPLFFREAQKLGLEGVISKLLGQPYRSGRDSDWLKIKCS
jgi:bifunctional non-homologous end joining protein LigD